MVVQPGKMPAAARVRVVSDSHCPMCGASFDDITRSGRVGCAECYRVFADRLAPLLQRLHGGARHCGKLPGTNLSGTNLPGAGLPQVRPEHSLALMRSELREAISTQNFEEAATLRDRIKALESSPVRDDGE